MSSIINFVRAIGLIWRNRDRLAPLLQTLPEAVHTAGHGMDVAGQGAAGAGHLLHGGGQVPVNARSSVQAVAGAVSEARQRVAETATRVRAAAQSLGATTVPVPDLEVVPSDGPEVVTGVAVTPVFGASLGPISVMTGLDISPTTTRLPGIPSISLSTNDVAVFAPVADALSQGASHLDSLAAALGDGADGLEALATALGNAGDSFETLGENLRTGGQALEQVTEPWVQ